LVNQSIKSTDQSINMEGKNNGLWEEGNKQMNDSGKLM